MWKDLQNSEESQSEIPDNKRKEIHLYGKLGKILRTLSTNNEFGDDEVHIFIERANKRSDQHSRYYFGMLRALSMETGYDVEELHEICKREVNTHIRHVLNKKTGEIQEKVYGGSTKRMKVGEFANYVEGVKRFWAGLGYVLKDEYWLDNEKEKGLC